MLRVGLTGNIGSGKSTVARIFESLGAAVFNADEEAKRAISEPRQQEILITQFGKGITGPDHAIDRRKLAELIFNDKEALGFVNHLIHPIVRKRFNEFCDKNSKTPLCIYEAAILIETGYYTRLDRIIYVNAPEELRIQRVMQRDGVDRKAVLQRMKNQLPEEQKKKFGDHIIINDESVPLLDQCLKVFNELAYYVSPLQR